MTYNLRFLYTFLMFPYPSLFHFFLPVNSFLFWSLTFQSLDIIIFVIVVFVRKFVLHLFLEMFKPRSSTKQISRTFAYPRILRNYKLKKSQKVFYPYFCNDISFFQKKNPAATCKDKFAKMIITLIRF